MVRTFEEEGGSIGGGVAGCFDPPPLPYSSILGQEIWSASIHYIFTDMLIFILQGWYFSRKLFGGFFKNAFRKFFVFDMGKFVSADFRTTPVCHKYMSPLFLLTNVFISKLVVYWVKSQWSWNFISRREDGKYRDELVFI